MASALEYSPHGKLAGEFLKFLQNPDDGSQAEFWQLPIAAGENLAEVCEQLRLQSNKFALIYPLLEHAVEMPHRIRLLYILTRCAESSVSAKLLAKEERVWAFLVRPLFSEDGPEKLFSGGDWICNVTVADLIINLLPHVSKCSWKFACECGFLKYLLAALQTFKSPTCRSSYVLFMIKMVLSRKTTQGCVDELVSNGLFTRVQELVQKSGNVLEDTPDCVDCGFNIYQTNQEGVSLYSWALLDVKKTKPYI